MYLANNLNEDDVYRLSLQDAIDGCTSGLRSFVKVVETNDLDSRSAADIQEIFCELVKITEEKIDSVLDKVSLDRKIELVYAKQGNDRGLLPGTFIGVESCPSPDRPLEVPQ